MKTSKHLRWALANKLLILFIVISFCLFVSTLVLAVKNIKLKREIKLNSMQDFTRNATTPLDSIQSNQSRLSKYVKPTNYRLKLWPDLSKKTFVGNVTIALQILEPTRVIHLHAKDLNIHSLTILNQNNYNIVESTTNLIDLEMIQINLAEKVKPSINYEIHITYSGRLDKGIVGFYESTMHNGK